MAKALCLLLAIATTGARAGPAEYSAVKAPVPDAVAARMRQHSWREGCPVPVDALAYLRLPYMGFDGKSHQGELVVQSTIADETIAVFKELYEQRFPIEKMRLVDAYDGDDEASMADNNTSGFNCRFAAGKPGVYSKHSFGRAIDINPRTNPMIIAGVVHPDSGTSFADRNKDAPGMLKQGSPAVKAFERRGWVWGGRWTSLKDYQHFER